MSKRANPAVVGGFVVGAIVLVAVAIVAIGTGTLWRTTYPYIVYFTGSVNGLSVGAPVKFKGIEVGSVTDILLNAGGMSVFEIGASEARVPVIIALEWELLEEKGGMIRPDESTVRKLIDRGLRARLSSESFVTGVLYVGLDFHPGTPVRWVNDPGVMYAEIPSLPTPLEEAEMRAAEFIAELEEADLVGLVQSLRRTIDNAGNLFDAPGLKATMKALPDTVARIGTAADDLRATLASVRELSANVDAQVPAIGDSLRTASNEATETLKEMTTTLTSLRQTVAPESLVVYQLTQALTELAEAASAVRRLAEGLERNPGVLVRGRAPAEED